MKKTIFKGSGVAIVTPMNEDGSVNYDEYGKLIEFQIENGTDAIITCGTTGESATLSHEEHCKVIKYTVDKVKKRIPVIAGTGSNDTAFAVELSKEAQRLGVDGLLVVTPYYNKASQSGLIKHYNAIADSVDLPIILYNVPSRTGCAIKTETYIELSKHKNICAIKEANGDISSVAKTLSLCSDDIDVYSGNDDQTLPIMALGGIGVISVFANVCPRQMHDLTNAMINGDLEMAKKIQFEYLDLMEALFLDVNPIPVKKALNLMGFNCGSCRLPLSEPDDKVLSALKISLKKHGLIK